MNGRLILFLLVLPAAVQSQSRATVGIAEFAGSGGTSTQAVVRTVKDTLAAVISMTGRFQPASFPEVLPPESDLLRSVGDRNGYDNIITGEISAGAGGQIRITLQVYNRAEDAITVRIREEADTLFSVFDAVDRAVVNLLEGLTGEPVEFGTIEIAGDWRGDSDRITLDGTEFQARGGRILGVLARDYELTVTRSGVGIVLTGRITVPANGSVAVTVPLLQISTATMAVSRATIPEEQFVFGRNGSALPASWTPPPATDAPAPGNAITLGHDLAGRELHVYGFTEPFQGIADSFTAETRITVVSIPPEEQDWRIDITLAREAPPEIIRIGQPGPIFDLLQLGLVEDLYTSMDSDLLLRQFGREYLAFTERDGRSVAIPIALSLKSLYWYSPRQFDALAISPPETQEEFASMLETFRSAGITPYGFAMESGEAATGWPFTDLVEDRMLQSYEPGVYDAWARGELGFSGTVVADVITELTYQLRDEEMTHGGPEYIVETPFWQSVDLLLSPQPYAGIVFAPSFYAGWYQKQLPELAVFPAPQTVTGERRLLLGGDVLAIAQASPEARAFLRYVTRTETARTLAGTLSPGNVVPHRAALPEWYGPFERQIAEFIDSADLLRFNGSDTMTRVVGMELFLTAGRSLMKGSAIRGVVRSIEEARGRPGLAQTLTTER